MGGADPGRPPGGVDPGADAGRAGTGSREVAERLVVSVRTVAGTLYPVCEKVGVGDRAEPAGILRIA
ncbi:hypothetical protein GCM10010156_10420 [Planobispora rosea]|uniref:LuxR family transcriptional regulator n=1 Tax=Planobispora rosea TaxID=35762 RepID=A0A8J3RWR1_PLARO|nr:hypothetical protein GCM10010156_10420 [Planobispora rosea]GIH82643.1 hypothetical protein Pro02_10510 [Planobispora rosea]